MKKFLSLSLTIMFLAFISVNAQTEIAPEKLKVLKELSAIVNEDNKTEDIAKLFMGMNDKLYQEIVKSVVAEREDLTFSEKKALELLLIENYQNKTVKFQEKLVQRLELDKWQEEVFATVYDKFFTLEELTDLLNFYKSPTGRKSLTVLQPLMKETMTSVQDKLLPKMMIVIKEIELEERLELNKKAEELKPRKKKVNK